MSWLLVARVVSILTSIVTASVLARLLAPADFGAQAVIGIILLLAAALSDGTFSVPLMQRGRIDSAMVASAVWLSVLVGAGCTLALGLCAGLIGRATHVPHLGPPLVLTALVLPIRGLSSVGTALLERSRAYRQISLTSVAGNITYTVLAIAMAVAGFGLWSLVIPTLVQVVLESLANTLQARLPLRTRPSRSGVADLFHAGAATTLTQLLNWAGLNAPGLITSNLLGPAALGFYARAANLQNTALQLTGGPMGRVLIPTFASLQGSPDKIREAFQRFLGAVLPLNALLSAAVIVHAELIVRLLLGRKWVAAIPILQILFAGFLPRSAYKVTEALALGSGRFGAAAVRQGVYFGAVCVGAVVGVRFGLTGLTVGVVGGLWLFYLVSLSQARGLTGLSWRSLALEHARALMLAALVAFPDYLVVTWMTHVLPIRNSLSLAALAFMFVANLCGGGVAILLLCVAVAGFAPVFGTSAIELRRRLARAGRAALAKLG